MKVKYFKTLLCLLLIIGNLPVAKAAGSPTVEAVLSNKGINATVNAEGDYTGIQLEISADQSMTNTQMTWNTRFSTAFKHFITEDNKVTFYLDNGNTIISSLDKIDLGTFTFTEYDKTNTQVNEKASLVLVDGLLNVYRYTDISVTSSQSNSSGGSSSNDYVNPLPIIKTNAGGSASSSSDGKTITITPLAGYKIANVIINGKSVGAVSTYIFQTATNTNTVEVVFEKTEEAPTGVDKFSDVKNHWGYESISYLYEKGYINGISATEFAPNKSITRAEFLAILARIDGNTFDSSSYVGFSDVKSTDWYSEYVTWGVSTGITTGISTTQFGPNVQISRQDMAVMITRFLTYKNQTLEATRESLVFADSSNISNYAKNAVDTLYKLEIINGKNNNMFEPTSNATRAEACKMLEGYLKKV